MTKLEFLALTIPTESVLKIWEEKLHLVIVSNNDTVSGTAPAILNLVPLGNRNIQHKIFHRAENFL